jgi:hypothetical protein
MKLMIASLAIFLALPVAASPTASSVSQTPPPRVQTEDLPAAGNTTACPQFKNTADERKMRAVERLARNRGVSVIWVNPPQRKTCVEDRG